MRASAFLLPTSLFPKLLAIQTKAYLAIELQGRTQIITLHTEDRASRKRRLNTNWFGVSDLILAVSGVRCVGWIDGTGKVHVSTGL